MKREKPDECNRDGRMRSFEMTGYGYTEGKMKCGKNRKNTWKKRRERVSIPRARNASGPSLRKFNHAPAPFSFLQNVDFFFFLFFFGEIQPLTSPSSHACPCRRSTVAGNVWQKPSAAPFPVFQLGGTDLAGIHRSPKRPRIMNALIEVVIRRFCRMT